MRYVSERRITGSEFLTAYCDEMICRNDIANKVIDFVDEYYIKNYSEDYKNFVENKLNKRICGIVFNWEEYDEFKKIINDRYRQYLNNQE